MFPCDKTGRCQFVELTLPENDGKPFVLFESNRLIAEIFLRTLRISERKQYTFSTKKGEFSKFIPTISHLDTVIDNFYEEFTSDERSNIIDKISKIYPVFFNARARV